MYCPKCNQQAAKNTRFCSRCGFPLTFVRELLATEGGILPKEKDVLKAADYAPRQKGVRKGLVLIIVSLVMSLIVGLMTAFKQDFFVLFLPALIVFIIGLVLLLNAVFLKIYIQPQEKENVLPSANRNNKPFALSDSAQAAYLPALQNVPIGAWRQESETEGQE